MFYKKYEPTPKLKSFINTYYIWEDFSNTKPLIIESPPSSYCAMVFNLGDKYKAGVYGEELSNTHEIFFIGQATKSYTLNLSGKICMIGVVFYATSLYHFLSESMDSYVNIRTDASKFLGDSAKRLHKLLCKEDKAEVKVQLIDDYFRSIIERKKVERDRFDESVDYIDLKHGNVSSKVVADQFGFSVRYYQKLFLKRVGVSPKSFKVAKNESYLLSAIYSERDKLAGHCIRRRIL